MPETLFRFKKFEVKQEDCAMKINTDGVLLGAWVDVDHKSNILDIGSGSGVIAMMLAQRTHDALITGVEIDQKSFEEARHNMNASPWAERLRVCCTSIQNFSEVDQSSQYDLIVSNPPFFSGGTLSATQEKTDVRHTTKLSHSDLLRSSFSLLNDEGCFSVILPYLEGLRFIELAEQYRLHCGRITEVRSFPDQPIERLLLTFKKHKTTWQKSTLAIRIEPKIFSEEYKKLTKDFYLKF
ncbi:tRNA1(Val) (adenine(37)-N6)-methyltransferase [Portibacter marinus]|uniref:tRNA1(Val) (adenine(37)-N6)-methyltransferase n=1 Tax=Portibacter marinus TaxID=2898660 RepID=UPI001F1E7AF7|nr:methyltransferase [Portibacter marinus]